MVHLVYFFHMFANWSRDVYWEYNLKDRNYQQLLHRRLRMFLSFLMLRQMKIQETHSIYGFALNDIHCTSCDCCYFKFSYLTGMLKNEPVQTLQGYLSDMTETATLFLCTFSLDFTVLEFLYLFSISISLFFHLENMQIDE